jgi:hypothetical protein
VRYFSSTIARDSYKLSPADLFAGLLLKLHISPPNLIPKQIDRPRAYNQLGGGVVCVLDTDGEEPETRGFAERRRWDLAQGGGRVVRPQYCGAYRWLRLCMNPTYAREPVSLLSLSAGVLTV